MRNNMEKMKKKHFDELEQMIKENAIEVNRLEDKRLNMQKTYEKEIEMYLGSLGKKDERLDELQNAIRKALKMMQYPRLMQLITRELNYDRLEYTAEEKISLADAKLHLTEKEENEIRDCGIVLCPQTLTDFYTVLRRTEQEHERAQDVSKIDQLRLRNTHCEGSRLRYEKEAKRSNFYPKDVKMKEHFEKLNSNNYDSR